MTNDKENISEDNLLQDVLASKVKVLDNCSIPGIKMTESENNVASLKTSSEECAIFSSLATEEKETVEKFQIENVNSTREKSPISVEDDKIKDMIKDINNSKVLTDQKMKDIRSYEQEIMNALNNLEKLRVSSESENVIKYMIEKINRSKILNDQNFQDVSDDERENQEVIEYFDESKDTHVIDQKINDMIHDINVSKIFSHQQLQDLADYEIEIKNAINQLAKCREFEKTELEMKDIIDTIKQSTVIDIETLKRKANDVKNYDLDIKKAILKIWKTNIENEYNDYVSKIVEEISQKNIDSPNEESLIMKPGNTFYFKYNPDHLTTESTLNKENYKFAKNIPDQNSVILKPKRVVDIMFAEIEFNHKFPKTPIRPDRKRRSPSVPALNTLSHYNEIHLITRPPRRKFNLSKNLSYSVSDVNYSRDEEDLSGLNLEDCSKLNSQSQNDIRFLSPNITLHHHSQTSVNVLKTSLDNEVKKTSFGTRRKSHSFTKGDIYMKNIRKNVSTKSKKNSHSVSKLLKRTFSLRELPKSDNPPCMPNLYKRYRLRKKKSRNNLPTIREDSNHQELDLNSTTKSFASIFLSDYTEDESNGTYLEICTSNFDPYESMKSLHFPKDYCTKRRSISQVLIATPENLERLDQPPIKAPRLKRSRSFTETGINNYHLVKIFNNNKSRGYRASLNEEAIRDAQKLLAKSVAVRESTSLSIGTHPIPPKRTKSKLNLFNLSEEKLSEKTSESFNSIFGSAEFADPSKIQEVVSRQTEMSVFYDDRLESLTDDADNGNNELIQPENISSSATLILGPSDIEHNNHMTETVMELEHHDETLTELNAEIEDIHKAYENHTDCINTFPLDGDINSEAQRSQCIYPSTNFPPDLSVIRQVIKTTKDLRLQSDDKDIHELNNIQSEDVIHASSRQYSQDLKTIGIDVDEYSADDAATFSPKGLVKVKSWLHSKESPSSPLEDLNGYLLPSYHGIDDDNNTTLNLSEEALDHFELRTSPLTLKESEIDHGSGQDFIFSYLDETNLNTSKDFIVDRDTFAKDCEDGTLNIKLQKLAKYYEKDLLDQTRRLSGDYERCLSPYVDSQQLLKDEKLSFLSSDGSDSQTFETLVTEYTIEATKAMKTMSHISQADISTTMDEHLSHQEFEEIYIEKIIQDSSMIEKKSNFVDKAKPISQSPTQEAKMKCACGSSSSHKMLDIPKQKLAERVPEEDETFEHPLSESLSTTEEQEEEKIENLNLDLVPQEVSSSEEFIKLEKFDLSAVQSTDHSLYEYIEDEISAPENNNVNSPQDVINSEKYIENEKFDLATVQNIEHSLNEYNVIECKTLNSIPKEITNAEEYIEFEKCNLHSVQNIDNFLSENSEAEFSVSENINVNLSPRDDTNPEKVMKFETNNLPGVQENYNFLNENSIAEISVVEDNNLISALKDVNPEDCIELEKFELPVVQNNDYSLNENNVAAFSVAENNNINEEHIEFNKVNLPAVQKSESESNIINGNWITQAGTRPEECNGLKKYDLPSVQSSNSLPENRDAPIPAADVKIQDWNSQNKIGTEAISFQPSSLVNLSSRIWKHQPKIDDTQFNVKNISIDVNAHPLLANEQFIATNTPEKETFIETNSVHINSNPLRNSLHHLLLGQTQSSFNRCINEDNTIIYNEENSLSTEPLPVRNVNNNDFSTGKNSKIYHFPSETTLSRLDEVLYEDISQTLTPLPSPILAIRELYIDKDRKIIEIESPNSKRKYYISSVCEDTPPASPTLISKIKNRDMFKRKLSEGKESSEVGIQNEILESEDELDIIFDDCVSQNGNILDNFNENNLDYRRSEQSGSYNSIKEDCSYDCRCADNDSPISDQDIVKILTVHEKRLSSGEESPEILVRTWFERQDRIEELSTPSPVSIPKWVKDDTDSDTDIHFYLPQGKETPSPGPDLKKIDDKSLTRKEDDRTQQDRCVEVYPETLRQRQRNMAPSPNKVDIKNWEATPTNNNNDNESKSNKKMLPSVKALRNQFENGKASKRDVSPTERDAMSSSSTSSNLGRTSSNSSTSSLVMSSLEISSGFGSLTSSHATIETPPPRDQQLDDEPVEAIFRQFQDVDQELKDVMSKPPSTSSWDPIPLLKKLYYVPETPKLQSKNTNYINIDGYLEKLPSGRKKATFWNAWKRRFFVAKDGVLYYYQNEISEKPNMKLSLMGGKVEIMDPNMVSVDDGKGHYVVVRCISRQEAERWKKALETHTVEDSSGHYVHPWPKPTNLSLLRDTLVIDIGSCSVRAGVLASQPTLPQLFFPSIVSINRETRKQTLGMEALSLESRTGSVLSFPIRPSQKISKFSVDLNAISNLLQKTFSDLKVDPRSYNLQLSVPRVLNPHTQAELLKILFEKFGIKSVNLTHQSILALYAYNATSGIVVDIGERLDVVPVIDGYIVDGGVSRIPYGGYRIMEHLRHFLFQRNLSLVNEVDSYVIRQVLESVCYCAQHYNTEKSRCSSNPESFEKTVKMTDFFPDKPEFEAFRNITLDYGRFQATEGIFNPDAWGLDHPGLHKLVHKAIQECSMDIRKEMSRSIYLVGGVSQLPGIGDRLASELDILTPPAIRPKVHASPYRYHASYLGACVLAESPAFEMSKITKEEWQKQGNSALRKWAL